MYVSKYLKNKDIIVSFFVVILLSLNLKYQYLDISSNLMWSIWVTLSFFSLIIIFKVFTEHDYKAKTNTFLLIFFQPLQYILSFASFYQSNLLCDGNGYITTLTTGDYLYFSIVTWTTLGYGDMKPPIDSRLLASIEGYTGYIFAGLIIAGFLKLLTRLDIQYNSLQ